MPETLSDWAVSCKAAVAVAVTTAVQRIRTINGLVPAIGIEGGAKFNSASTATNTGV
jgi:hypothetical protein